VRASESIFSRDPDERVIRWGWVFWFCWLAVGGALLLGDLRGGAPGLGIVLAAPFWALWLLWAFYRGACTAVHWLHRSGRSQWSGRYCEFDGRQVRIEFDADAIWFGADDVFAVLDTPAGARDPERVRLIVGRDGLQPAPASALLSFSEKGLAAFLDRRSERSARQFARWVDTQVVAPYRRRRELEDEGDAPGAS
jgi:hypothetical protein